MEKKSKILQIGSLDNTGGAASISWNLHNAIEKNGWDSKMYVGYKYSNDPDVLSFYRNTRGKFNYYQSALLASDISFFNTKKLFKSKAYKNANIVHLHNLHASFFNLKSLERISKEKKVLWTLHDMWPLTGHCAHSFNCKNWEIGCGNCPDLRTYPRILWDNTSKIWGKKKNIYNNSNLILVSPSVWLKNKVEKSILKDKDIKIIPNGIDNKMFKQQKKDRVRKNLGLPSNKKIILFLSDGGIENKWKGGDFLKKVVEKYKNDNSVLFLSVGGNKTRKDDIYDNLHFIKKTNDKNMLSEYYSVADIFLFTSLAENFPLVILEAMSCGLPVVSFDVGGVKEAVIHNKTGYIARYKNTNDILNGINYVFNLDKEEYEKMSKESRNEVEKKYTTEIMTDQYTDLYKSLL